MTQKKQLRKLFKLIGENTDGNSFESGGCAIDFYNGLSISYADIENWLKEYLKKWEKVFLLEDKILEESYDIFNLDCDEKFKEELEDNLISKYNSKLKKLLKTDKFVFSTNSMQCNFNLENYILFKAKQIENKVTSLITLKNKFLEKDTTLSEINTMLNGIGYTQVTNNNDVLESEKCVWSKQGENSIVFQFNTNATEYTNKLYVIFIHFYD